jgi:alpha-D-ribose 1-methylphosphonate 5-triphosphate synthase subunit PhnG|tara:strand:+ start:137 stop:559 length:423 start_codon:yes stop_codon:yes gene_type:complete
MDIETRSSLLAAAERSSVIALAERLVEQHGHPSILLAPEVGLVALEVREPVCSERFIVGDVLITRAEVVVGSAEGWAARMGDDREATFAAAICAAVGDHRLGGADEVDHLCEATAHARDLDAMKEWSDLTPTIVDFEEMD